MLFALCPFLHLTFAKLLRDFDFSSAWLLKFQLSLCNPSCDTLQLKTKRLRYCLRDHRAGGDKGIRTLDPLLAGQVLSQLSYTPIYIGLFS